MSKQIATQLLGALDRASVALHKDEPRKHLGASIIGHECERSIFYSFRWFKTKGVFDGRMLRLFGRGHREEAVLAALLEKAGITLFLAGENGENKDALRISDHEGHFGGTPDGVATNVPGFAPDSPLLVEFKTFNEKQFDKMLDGGVIATKFHYFVQMQIYMHYHKLQNAVFIGSCKNDDRIYIEIVMYDSRVAEKYIERAGRIVKTEVPPPRISESPGKWPCTYCEFQGVCHFPEANFPEINCRTCLFSTVGPNGTWLCKWNRPEIAGQKGCAYHTYDVLALGGEVTAYDEEAGSLSFTLNGVKETVKFGLEASQELSDNALVPF